ncbi:MULTISPECIES: S1C family serine protease [Nocardiaceae]|uniref:Trypsin-like peptidase domain-containing protein n=1 Tax=Rhodococcoides yunnanense TaxID=278209 RepID=A0ABU4B889_9NOCA|nr:MULTISPECIES: trypsin-like peptidase domain-containing protein [Rhodococcus]MDI9893868.1 trypsin-like peptidase domain-containing protein [Rhodococcus sp. IEGM 1381]MDV6260405.1 trypsin-like peptidase domain-containing protein [Rhodococcus yunnanensis]
MRSGGRAVVLTLVAAGVWLFATPPLDPGTADFAAAPAPVPPVAPVVEPPPLTLDELSARVDPAVVTLSASAGFSGVAGTGFVVAPDGIVLTNFHVVEFATEITAVNMGNGLIYDATVLGYDKSRDVAVVQLITAADLPVVELAPDPLPDVGDAVTAIGNASGAGVLVPAPGTVTALDQQVRTRSSVDGSRNTLDKMIRVDADVRAGDSGGPLFDAWGRVVGVNTAGLSDDARNGTEFVPPQAPEAYAVPIGEAVAVLDQVLAGQSGGTVHVGPTPYFGVSVRDVSVFDNKPAIGAAVVSVNSDSPAEILGLSAGDIIVSLDGTEVQSSSDLSQALIGRVPGDSAVVEWVDDAGITTTGTVTLAQGTPTA